MKKKRDNQKGRRDDLRADYDLRTLHGRARGKYAARYRRGTNLVLLSPDVARHFPDADSVNAALRSLIPAAKPARRRH